MWTHLGVGFGLVVAAVTFVVWTGTGIFMYCVQQPEEELEGIVLRVPSELGAILGHCALRRRHIKNDFLLVS